MDHAHHPAVLPPSQDRVGHPVALSDQVGAPLARPHAIVLDDDPTVRMVLVEAMKTAGMTVCAADCAEAAFAALVSLPRPALLITDIDLGNGPNGIAVAAHARELWPDMPIFVVSGGSSCDESLEARLRVQFFRKPVRIATLLAAITAMGVTGPPEPSPALG